MVLSSLCRSDLGKPLMHNCKDLDAKLNSTLARISMESTSCLVKLSKVCPLRPGSDAVSLFITVIMNRI